MSDGDRSDGDFTAAPARDALDKVFDIAALGIEPVMSLTPPKPRTASRCTCVTYSALVGHAG
jgi:hypothetical protein